MVAPWQLNKDVERPLNDHCAKPFSMWYEFITLLIRGCNKLKTVTFEERNETVLEKHNSQMETRVYIS